MTHSFIAYIDESGDDGLRSFRSPPGTTGSTQWLTISCCVARYINDLEFVKWRDEIGNAMPNRQRREIHFRDLNHNAKLKACQKISRFPLRCITALSNKTTIAAGTYAEKNQLYHYITRYVIERMSWLCRDMRPQVPEGNGQVKIVFSRRGGMDYPDFQNYLRTLQALPATEDVRVHWSVIDIDAVEAQDHSSLAGLQIADCIASAVRYAVEPEDYGNCEDRYARCLKPVTYHRGNNYLSYGLKPLPALNQMTLSTEQQDFFTFFQ